MINNIPTANLPVGKAGLPVAYFKRASLTWTYTARLYVRTNSDRARVKQLMYSRRHHLVFHQQHEHQWHCPDSHLFESAHELAGHAPSETLWCCRFLRNAEPEWEPAIGLTATHSEETGDFGPSDANLGCGGSINFALKVGRERELESQHFSACRKGSRVRVSALLSPHGSQYEGCSAN